MKLKFVTILSIIAIVFPFPIFSQSDNGETSSTYNDLIIRLGERLDEDISYLESNGVKVLNHRGDLCLTLYPTDLDINSVLYSLPSFQSSENEGSQNYEATNINKQKGKRLQYLSEVKRMVNKNFVDKFNTIMRNVPAMDVNRHCYNLQSTIESEEVKNKIPELDGRGVVVGFCDIGFDARHVNFKSSDGKELRVKKVVHINESAGTMDIYSSPEDIYAWHTDTEDNFHATHVCGIMAGGCKINNYHGIAPGADIVATTSNLTDVGVLTGVEEIISYAKEVGKPAVVNISLGNYNGPHDGSSLFVQYLDRCAEDAIICVASGNEGDILGHIGMNLTDAKPFLQMQFASSDWVHFNMYGMTDIYSDSSEPFDFTLYVREDGTRAQNFKYETPKLDFTKHPQYVLTSNPELAEVPGYIYSPEFAEGIEGEIYAYGETDSESNRFHVQVFYMTKSERKAQDKYDWAHYRIGAMAYGKAGQRIDAFADCSHSRFERVNGNPVNPDNSFSVSDMATGHHTISVGMYFGREAVQTLSGGFWGGGQVGTVSQDSGYGTLLDGRILPMTVAPGLPIISSLSGAYIKKYSQEGMTCFSYSPEDSENVENNDELMFLYSDNSDKETYYWGPYGGTSMATPYVAGVMALCCQIKPDLKSGEAQELIMKTNDSESHSYSQNARNAQGFFNPSDCLLNLVSQLPTSVETITGGTRKFIVDIKRDGIIIANPDGEKIDVEIYSAEGMKIKVLSGLSETYLRIPDAELPRGLSIIKATSEGSDAQVFKFLK